MNLILIILYSVITFIFIPLFSVIMYKLKKDYIPVYTKVACKMLVFFVIFMVFLLLRLFIYIDMSFSSSDFNGLEDVELNQEIPFFLSEVIITFAFSYMLFQVTKSARNNETLKQKEEMLRMNNKVSMNFRSSNVKVGANPTFSDSYEERLTFDKKLSSNIKMEDLYNVSPDSNIVRLEYEGEEEEKEYESVRSGRNENDIRTIEADSLLEDNFDDQVQIRLVHEDQMLISPKSI